MEYIEVVVPSHKRADRVLTKKVVHRPIICVPEKQYVEYKKHNSDCEIVAHPDSVVGLPPKLEWIRKNFGNIFLLDDDCTGFKRMYDTKDVNVKEPELVREIIESVAASARQAGAFLFGFGKDPNPVTYNAHEPIQMTGFVLGGATGLLTGSKLFWNSDMQINGDYWISLLNAYYHRICYKDMRYCFTFEKTFTNKGGLAGVRNTEMLEKHYHLLKQHFGDAIQLKGNNKAVRKKKSEWEMTINLPY